MEKKKKPIKSDKDRRLSMCVESYEMGMMQEKCINVQRISWTGPANQQQ